MNEPVRQAWANALERARTEQLVVWKTGGALGVGAVVGGAVVARPYTLTPSGPRPIDVTCTCKAAEAGRICKHRAAAVFARKYRVYAVAPAAVATNVA